MNGCAIERTASQLLQLPDAITAADREIDSHVWITAVLVDRFA